MPKDNSNELFYLVDDDDNAIGSVKRAEAHRSNSIKHRSIFILLFNDRDELLLQKRSQGKDTFPGFWTVSTSGHVAYGQSYDEAARRELQEEIGLNLPLERLQKIYVKEEREFAFIYRGFFTDEVKINFDQDEVSEVRWVALEKLAEFIKENDLTPSALTVLNLIHPEKK
jgi:isopentenyl-diphosphate delta-isomerase type 1